MSHPGNDPDAREAVANGGGRILTSPVPLQLYYFDDHGRKQPAGSTVGLRPVEVPGANNWIIEPRRTLSQEEWDGMIALMSDMQIPGVSAAGQMTDELLDRVTRLDHVTCLDLHGSRVTDAGLSYLTRVPRVQHLDLNGCRQITDRGLEVLAHLPHLETLSCVMAPLSDAGLRHLEKCHRLRRVNLMGTGSGDATLAALRGKERLRHLYAGNDVTDAGLSLFHEFPVFKTWQGGEVVMSLLSFSAEPSYLWLNLTAALTDAAFGKLAGLDGLFALNLYGKSGPGAFDARGSALTPAGLGHVAKLTHLGWLGCNVQLATDAAMRQMSKMAALRFVMCESAPATDDGFIALSQSQSIEYVWQGRSADTMTARGFEALSAMPALRGLSVSARHVSDEGLSSLPRFPALSEFMPIGVPDEGFRHVGGCQRLEALHCMYCENTTDAATAHITGLPNLKTYQAWSTQITDRTLEMLGRMRTLESLLFSDCAHITDRGLASLAALPRLREIVLDALPKTTPQGAAVFPPHVRVNIVSE